MLRLQNKIQAWQKQMSDGITGQVDELRTSVQGLVAASHKPDEGEGT